MGLFKSLIGMALDIAQGRTWSFTDAEFTGVCKDKNNNLYDKIVPEGTVIDEYLITYHVPGRRDLVNWYKFPKGEMPDPAELAGCTIEIRYDESEPLFYDAVGEVRPRGEAAKTRPFGKGFQLRIGF